MPKTDNDTAEIMIEHLRYMRGKLDILADAVGDLKSGQLSIRNDINRVERMQFNLEQRMERIERRVDLVDS